MTDFPFGVIEGFYGRAWSWEARRDAVGFLHSQGFDTYIYAPKSDRRLRRGWRDRHDAAVFEALRALRVECRARGIRFGIGFSPWGLQAEYGARDRADLRRKLEHLNQLDCDILCILFDDMPGAIADLAQRQAAIVEDIQAHSNARRFLMCPTYYSFDPQLERLFGPMPSDYLETLGAELPAEVGIFWTGSLVLAPGFSREDIAAVAPRIGRKPVLWDNYPVNDGRRISRFLHLLPVRGRPWQLREWCGGHLANPMNQPCLSRAPLASLAHSYRLREAYEPERFWRETLVELMGAELAARLLRDVELFQHGGLDRIDERERALLRADYERIAHPAAREIVDWLNEFYQFDPECLND